MNRLPTIDITGNQIAVGRVPGMVIGRKLGAGFVGALDAPTNVLATAGDQTNALEWDGVTGASVYDIYRSITDDFGSSVILASDEIGTTFNDASGNAGTRYYYWVIAKNGAIESDPSISSGARSYVTISNGDNVLGLSIPIDADGTVNGALFAATPVPAGVTIIQDSNGIFYSSGGSGYWEDQFTTDPVASSPLTGVIDVYNDTGATLTFWDTEP